MSELLDRARAAVEGVTPGPWEASYHPCDTSYPSDQYHVITMLTGDTVAEVDDESRCYEEPHGEFGRDAKFIAAARQLVPEMLSELGDLEQAVTQVRELHGRKPYLIYGTEVREWHCRICDEPHPCPTLRALDGTEAP